MPNLDKLVSKGEYLSSDIVPTDWGNTITKVYKYKDVCYKVSYNDSFGDGMFGESTTIEEMKND